jgi:uncharacterized damage-inducible protein DinB
MITPDYARTMADYNAEMNRRLYDAASRLSEEARLADRGAFWGGIHGTLAHLLWGDFMWMHRFAGWPSPPVGMAESPNWQPDFAALRAAREAADAGIIDWAATLEQGWLDEELVWFSGALGREMRKRRGLLVAHMFNHQTHHRGQAHALITAAGEQTGDTDLFILVP